MIEIEDNKLIVKNLDGNDITINVIDIIENNDTGKKFICYNIENLNEVFISSLEENEESFSLGEVTDEEKNIQNYIRVKSFCLSKDIQIPRGSASGLFH